MEENRNTKVRCSVQNRRLNPYNTNNYFHFVMYKIMMKSSAIAEYQLCISGKFCKSDINDMMFNVFVDLFCDDGDYDGGAAGCLLGSLRAHPRRPPPV